MYFVTILLLFSFFIFWASDGRAQQSRLRAQELAELKLLRVQAATHPQVRTAEAEVEAARKRISMRSTLMDPMLTLGLENLPINSFQFNQDMMTSKSIAVSQQVPFPGKLAAARRADEQQVITAEESVYERSRSIRQDVTQSYFSLYPLLRSIDLYEEHEKILIDVFEIAKTRFETAQATQQDLIQLELRKVDLQRSILTTRSNIAIRESELEGITGPLSSPVELPSSLSLPAFTFSLKELDSLAHEGNSVLRRVDSELKRLELEADLVRLNRYPDFNFMLMYMQRDALAPDAQMNPSVNSATEDGPNGMSMPLTDMLTFRLSLNLPLNYGGRQDDAEEELASMQRMQRSLAEAHHLELRSALKSRLAELGSLRDQHKLLLESSLPLLKLSLETGIINYQNFKADIISVLNAQLVLLQRTLEGYQIQSDYYSTLAEIEYLVGKDLLTDNIGK